MSRPRVNPEEAAREAFRREIRVLRAQCDMKQSALADVVGVVPSVMSNLLADPDKISVGRMRRIVGALKPDLMVMLTLLGYSKRDLKELQKENSL